MDPIEIELRMKQNLQEEASKAKGGLDGLHSPFGPLGESIAKYHFSKEEVLWGHPWILILIMRADGPKYVRKKKEAPIIESAADLEKIFGKRNYGTD